jgi:CarD family transcriptional regulator
MFKKNSYVVYGMNGTCRVTDVTTLKMPGCDQKRKYYVLQPIGSESSRIYSPVDNNKVLIRPVISKREAKELLGSIDSIEEAVVPNEKFREETYKDILRSGDCKRTLGLLRTLIGRRRKRISQGRKITSLDERYFGEAMSRLTDELTVVLGEDHAAVTAELSDLLHASA